MGVAAAAMAVAMEEEEEGSRGEAMGAGRAAEAAMGGGLVRRSERWEAAMAEQGGSRVGLAAGRERPTAVGPGQAPAVAAAAWAIAVDVATGAPGDVVTWLIGRGGGIMDRLCTCILGSWRRGCADTTRGIAQSERRG